CSRVVPTTEEQLFKNQIIELTRGTVLASLPDRKRVEVQARYAPEDQVRVARKLRVLSKALQQCKALAKPKITLIPRARIPIIKMRAHSVNVDISISNDTGVKVAEFLTQQVQAYPPLKPLVLVLKTYLASLRLNDVAQGGLSSYSLCNMVIAHMQEEAKAACPVA
ncbi:poly(A) polymerase, partial [Haematococcus lacustris]